MATRSSTSATGAVLAAALGLLCAPPPAVATDTAATPAIPLTACRLEHPLGISSVAARCGELELAENPEETGGRRIRLAIAVIPAIATRARPDPLFLLAGGPGQGARETFVPMLSAFSAVRRDRDLVLVDQRGTGGSNRLDCRFPDETWDSADLDAAQFTRLANECLTTLPGDPRYYTTSIAVQDLDAVRAALGYQRINLYGGSYGTRVAQHYARRFPERTRTVTLDSVIDPQLALGASMALDAQAALAGSFERCRASAECRERFPDPAGQFAALRERLRDAAVRVSLPDPVSAEPQTVDFGIGHFALAVRMLSYSDLTAGLLPLLVDEAEARGNFAPLAAQTAMIIGQLRDALAYGMHNSVVCSEDLPFLDRAAIDSAALESAYLGPTMLDGLEAMCAVWPRGVVDADLKAPLKSDVPALLMSGGLDPVTPPAYAAAAAAGFSDHLNVVFRGHGHIQLGSFCAQSLLRAFLEAGTAQGLDAACVDKVEPMPFFLGFNGGAP